MLWRSPGVQAGMKHGLGLPCSYVAEGKFCLISNFIVRILAFYYNADFCIYATLALCFTWSGCSLLVPLHSSKAVLWTSPAVTKVHDNLLKQLCFLQGCQGQFRSKIWELLDKSTGPMSAWLWNSLYPLSCLALFCLTWLYLNAAALLATLAIWARIDRAAFLENYTHTPISVYVQNAGRATKAILGVIS